MYTFLCFLNYSHNLQDNQVDREKRLPEEKNETQMEKNVVSSDVELCSLTDNVELKNTPIDVTNGTLHSLDLCIKISHVYNFLTHIFYIINISRRLECSWNKSATHGGSFSKTMEASSKKENENGQDCVVIENVT